MITFNTCRRWWGGGVYMVRDRAFSWYTGNIPLVTLVKFSSYTHSPIERLVCVLRKPEITRWRRWWIGVFSICIYICNYFNSLTSSNVGELSWGWSRVVNPRCEQITKNVRNWWGKKVMHLLRWLLSLILLPVNCILYILWLYFSCFSFESRA